MTATWSTAPLGDRVVNLDRHRIPVAKKDRRLGPYPYYGASGVVDHVDRYIFEGLHVLVAEDGENLRSRRQPVAFLADGKFWVNNHAHILQGNNENNTRFLAYAVEHADLTGYLTGSAQPKLSQAALHAVPITAPPLVEQRGIAATLGALDDKIDSNRRANRLLHDWIDTQSIIIAGELPQTALRALAEAVKKTIKPQHLEADTVDHYSLPAFDAGAVPERVEPRTIKSNKNAVRGTSILLSRLNPRFNRTWWVEPDPHVPSMCSTEFLCLQADSDSALAGAWLAVRSPSFREELPSRVTGTSGSHQRVRPTDLLSIDVPDVRELSKDVTGMVSQMLAKAHQLRCESLRLAALRDALLPELLSGRVRVPEAAEVVQDAAS